MVVASGLPLGIVTETWRTEAGLGERCLEERCQGERCLGKRCLQFRFGKERWPRVLRLTVALGMRPAVAARGDTYFQFYE